MSKRKLAAIFFAEMTERFSARSRKMKDAKCIFDGEETVCSCSQLKQASLSQIPINN